MYGWPRSEALGQITHQLLQTRFPHSRDAQDAALRQAGRWEGELLHTRRDGTQVVVSSRQVVQRDTDGQPGVVLEINTDITDRKRAADALEHQVQQRTAHLNTLLQFSQVLLTARSLDAVLDRRCATPWRSFPQRSAARSISMSQPASTWRCGPARASASCPTSADRLIWG
jgi:PAS domain S-box-containing protein